MLLGVLGCWVLAGVLVWVLGCYILVGMLVGCWVLAELLMSWQMLGCGAGGVLGAG